MTQILRLMACALLALPFCVMGQEAARPRPDTITLVNGDKISGQIIGTTNRGIIFRGDTVGEITVEWSNIRDVHSENGFSGIGGPGGAGPATTPSTPSPTAGVPSPTVAPVAPPPASPPPAPAPVREPSSPAAQHSWPGFRIFSGWQVNAAAGISYLGATTSYVNFTPTINLERIYRKGTEAWPIRGRTFINFLINFSKETQHGDVAYFDPIRRVLIIPGAFMKTFTMHGEFAEDYFLFPRLFVQGGAIFDHNYAQSLDLLQSYGGGLGYVVYRSDRSEFDLRAGVGWAKQEYDGYPNFNTSVIGSRFYESFEHTFAHGISLSEQGGIRPAWTDPKYLFGGGQLSFNMPVYHHLNLNVSSFDFWSRTPPPMLKKNVFQVAVGVSYALGTF